jgi:Flp pilus assembly protein TadD
MPRDSGLLLRHYIIDMIDALDKSWLVKANGRVLGPFTKLEIYELLKNEEIVVLNEVISPYRRWQYIRDLDAFSDIVEELRVLEFGRNEDHTMTTSQTASVTEKVTENIVDERTDRVHYASPREIVIEQINEVRTQNKKVANHTSQFRANVKDDFINKQTEKFSKTTWFASIAIALFVVGFVSFKKLSTNSSDRILTAADHVKIALQHYYAGDYSLALPELHKAKNLKPSDERVKALLVPLMVMFEPEKRGEALALIEELQKDAKIEPERLAILRGLIYLKEKKFDLAREKFQQALRDNPFSWQAFANLGVVSFFEGDFLSAKNHFESALGVEVENRTSRGEVYLMRAAAEIYLWDNLKDDKYLKDAEAGLNSYIAEHSDYRQEALLLKSFILFATKQKEATRAMIEQMVGTDPKLTEEHSKDPYVDRSPIHWVQLLPWCEAIQKAWTGDSMVRTMHAICLVHNQGKDIEAQTEIGVAVSQNPKDPIVHAIFAYITAALGETSKAELLATKAIDLNATQLKALPNIVKARICEVLENFDCAVENWQAVRTLDKTSVSALGGLAFSYLKLKKFSLFESAYHEGSKYSQYYKPLLRARALAEVEGLNVEKK